MADAKFSFQCPGRMYSPAWMAPEGTVFPLIYESFSSKMTVYFKPGLVINRLLFYSPHCEYVSVLLTLIPGLQKKPEDINRRSADMWSFAVLLWELVTREVPFADLSHMEIGMKVSCRCL